MTETFHLRLLDPDNFSGVSSEDLDELSHFSRRLPDSHQRAGCITNFLGVQTVGSHHPYVELPDAGLVLPDLPFPDDKVHAQAIEYVALMRAMLLAAEKPASSDSLVCVELGASYGTWVVPFAYLAKIMAPSRHVEIITVEPTRNSKQKIHDHLELNGLSVGEGLSWKHHDGVISPRKKNYFFPDVDSAADNGGAPSTLNISVDYRGKEVRQRSVAGVTLRSLLKDFERIDFVHADLQGSELQLLKNKTFVSTITRKVHLLFLATHSREIEGQALKTLSRAGWQLMNERPVRFSQTHNPNPAGWSTTDGAQLWMNKSLVNS